MSNFKILTLAAAALALSACTSDKLEASYQGTTNTNSETPDNAIQFGTYLGKTGSTRAGSTGDIVAPNAVSGNKLGTSNYEFGVFAYYTGANTYGQQQHTTYSGETGSATDIAPNFMYNQKVSSSDEGATWTYSPIKYWPNEFANGDVDDNSPAAQGAAANGNVSFFAYAPYVSSTSGTYGITNMSANTATGDPTVTYTLSQTSFVDLLWGTKGDTNIDVIGTAQSGVTGSDGAGANTYAKAIVNGMTVNADLNKQKTEGKVGFAFKHALSKIGGYGNGTTTGFLVKLDIDNNGAETGGVREKFQASDADDSWRTIVTIKSITITSDLDGDDTWDSGETAGNTSKTLNLATGVWSDNSAGNAIIKQVIGDPSITAKDATLNTKIAEYYDNSNTWLTHATTTNYWLRYGTGQVANESNGDHPGVTETAQPVYSDATQSPIVLFPGTTPKFKITVDYIVRTYDVALSAGYTDVEQVITKQVDFTSSVEMNKHYSLLMHLGLTGVKFTASVSDWEEYDSDNVTEGVQPVSVELPINVQ